MIRTLLFAVAALFLSTAAAHAQSFCQSVSSCQIEDGRQNVFGILACQQEMTACAAESEFCFADCERAQNEARNLCDTFYRAGNTRERARQRDCIRRVRQEGRRCRRVCGF